MVKNNLTPEQKEFAQQIGETLDQDNGIWYNKSFLRKKEQKTTPTAKTTIKKQTEPDRRHQMVNSMRYWQILRTLRQRKSS